MKLSDLWLILLALGATAALVFMAVLNVNIPELPLPDRPAPAQYVPPSADANPQGTIRGIVRWRGDLPEQDVIGGLIQTDEGSRWTFVPNPFMPKVSNVHRGIAGAVVYLKQVDAKQSKPWDRGPVKLEMRKNELQIQQQGSSASIGFVRVGDAVGFVNRDAEYHSVRARGAAFFTLPFPQADQPLERTLTQPGHIDLSSGAGYFWCGADLFVCEHPYFTTTGTDGKFELNRVPAGNYEVRAWLRPYRILSRDRDPETGRIVRLHFADLPEATANVLVPKLGVAEAELSLSAK